MEKIHINDDKIFVLVKDENDFIDVYNEHPPICEGEDVLFVKGIGEFHGMSNVKYPQFFKKINPQDRLGIYIPYPKKLLMFLVDKELKELNDAVKRIQALNCLADYLQEVIDEQEQV